MFISNHTLFLIIDNEHNFVLKKLFSYALKYFFYFYIVKRKSYKQIIHTFKPLRNNYVLVSIIH